MLIVKCTTEFAVMKPDVDAGFVTWFDLNVHHAESELAPLGHARIALIHGGEALNYGEPIERVLDADSQELCELYDIFYKDGDLKPAYENGNGQDVLYVSDVEIATAYQDRMVEQALLRRVIEVLGGGCAIAIVPVTDLFEAERWESVGFRLIALAPTATRHGYVAMDLALTQPRVVEVDGAELRFRVEPRQLDESE